MPLLAPKVRVKDILLDHCYEDHDLDAVRDLVADQSRAPQERAAAALRCIVSRRAAPENQLLAQDVLAEAAADVVGELDSNTGDSSAVSEDDRADAFALAAAAHIRAAERLRRGGQTDADDRARRVHTELEEADDLALAGLRAVPDHPGCGLIRAVAGHARGVPEDDRLHRFQVALRREPLSVPAHLLMLQSVCAKWYGSHDAMFGWAQQTIHDAAAGHPVTMVLPLAHLEYLAAGEPDAPARRKQALPQVRGLSADLLAAEQSHPRSLEAHSAFGWFLAATGERAGAKAHLSRALRRPSWAWAYLDDDDRRPYAAVLREVGAAR